MSVILKDDPNQEVSLFVLLKAQHDSNHPFRTILKLYKWQNPSFGEIIDIIVVVVPTKTSLS